MISLNLCILIFYLVSLDNGRANEFLILPSLYFSPSLVRVFDRCASCQSPPRQVYRQRYLTRWVKEVKSNALILSGIRIGFGLGLVFLEVHEGFER